MSTRDLVKNGLLIGGMLLVILIVVVLVYFPPSGKLICTYSSAPGDPSAMFTYTADFNFWKVTKIESKEVVSSNSIEVLEEMKQAQEEALREYEGEKYIYFSNKIKEKEFISVSTIDYTKEDKKSLKKKGIDLSIRKLRNLYKNEGATCSYR